MAALGIAVLPSRLYSMTADSQVYYPGQSVWLTLTGPDFRGLLLYANPNDEPAKTIGSFTVPPQMQNNDVVCGGKNSSVTHSTIVGNYTGTQAFKWTAPPNSVGEIHFHLVIVQNTLSGFAYAAIPCAVIIKCASNLVPTTRALPSPPPVEKTPIATSPCSPPSTVTTTITQTIVQVQTAVQTVSQTVTQTILLTTTTLRKCKPRIKKSRSTSTSNMDLETTSVKPNNTPIAITCNEGIPPISAVIVMPVPTPASTIYDEVSTPSTSNPPTVYNPLPTQIENASASKSSTIQESPNSPLSSIIPTPTKTQEIPLNPNLPPLSLIIDSPALLPKPIPAPEPSVTSNGDSASPSKPTNVPGVYNGDYSTQLVPSPLVEPNHVPSIYQP
ncbi:UNVERIFIED_CONTAM: DOMON domain-containing protein frrs1L [Siphonaria sp. JEL0065]|nr:DOMON domain-containing protein frrs1L [Siphonaria sp. JEL0065]